MTQQVANRLEQLSVGGVVAVAEEAQQCAAALLNGQRPLRIALGPPPGFDALDSTQVGANLLDVAIKNHATQRGDAAAVRADQHLFDTLMPSGHQPCFFNHLERAVGLRNGFMPQAKDQRGERMRVCLHLCRQALRRAVQRRGERLTIGGVNRHELFLGPTAGLHSLQILSIKHDLLEWIVRARLRHRSLRFSRTVCRPPRGHLYLPPE
mmetsp:Transcript_12839/g.29926  ORF Transcript_12839/g.29926 Transcript_12839/m.29926 type:complete len:209 (+) Transcript_12839:640-1266(+)